MKRILISLTLTLFLGPGAGHLYLRQFKKALILISLSLLFVVYLALHLGKSLQTTQVSKENAPQVFQEYIAENPSKIFVYDAVYAALLAFALLDAYWKAREANAKETPPSESNDSTPPEE